ncbi:MATE family efflux transporter [Streptomyces sp. NPDC001100]
MNRGVLMGRWTGAGDAERARRVLLVALRIRLWATVAESLLLILPRHDIAAAFTTDEPVRAIVGSYILMTCPFFSSSSTRRWRSSTAS